jgi:hypothetical protein
MLAFFNEDTIAASPNTILYFGSLIRKGLLELPFIFNEIKVNQQQN